MTTTFPEWVQAAKGCMSSAEFASRLEKGHTALQRKQPPMLGVLRAIAAASDGRCGLDLGFPDVENFVAEAIGSRSIHEFSTLCGTSFITMRSLTKEHQANASWSLLQIIAKNSEGRCAAPKLVIYDEPKYMSAFKSDYGDGRMKNMAAAYYAKGFAAGEKSVLLTNDIV